MASNSRNPLVESVVRQVLANDEEFRAFGNALHPETGMADYHFATDQDPHDPKTVFLQVRWGGNFVFCSRSRDKVRKTAEQYSNSGFLLERPISRIRQPIKFLPFLGTTFHYFIARKMQLIPPGDFTDRFTYMVELTADKARGRYVVTKRVPTDEWVINRLKHRWPQLPSDTLVKRAKRFTEKIFPLFLTREAAILQMLQEQLPEQYPRPGAPVRACRERFPRLCPPHADELAA